MKVKDLIMKLIYCDPEAEARCVTYENANEDADEFALDIRALEDYEDNVDLVLDNLNVGRFNEDHVFEILRGKVLEWAKNKNLLHGKNSEKQFMKFIEEVFEFKTEMDQNIGDGIPIDSKLQQAFSRGEIGVDELLQKQKLYMELEMGDIFVTLIILCDQLVLDPVDCLDRAYEKIKDRKGKTINGVFIKEGDLK